jgi:hypothetical protein
MQIRSKSSRRSKSTSLYRTSKNRRSMPSHRRALHNRQQISGLDRPDATHDGSEGSRYFIISFPLREYAEAATYLKQGRPILHQDRQALVW